MKMEYKLLGKSYQCNICGRHIIAPTTNEVINKVKAHDLICQT